ncbi:MAG TPA: bifunctional phosphopantothenoylcysteine decarboxylase/phosphopantothenate--cysteine ligase CoaBC [Armatimonadota bacterium]|nr:bifunctional phosphopantothenoylcysteine decarboxylase/phosphopantothenate--cysteine ligase CoaBC [Armatimonadota bacterium]
MSLDGRKIIIGVTGSIAAYKACDVIRRLKVAGAEVRVVMTKSACELVGPTTFRAISGGPVAVEMFDGESGGDLKHISLTDWADAVLIVPATANILGKAANGIADDLVSTVLMACDAPTVFAPAMNFRMWANPAVQENVRKLAESGRCFAGPIEGRLASGVVGAGRMAEPDSIVETLKQALGISAAGSGLKVVITSGPTREYIDPVRFITNPSTGKMGHALALAARDTGAEVIVISGPTQLPPPAGVTTVDVVSADEMRAQVQAHAADADVVIAAAAPGDFTVAEVADTKVARGEGPITLELQPTEDIIAEVGRDKGNKVVVSFAAETGGGIERAETKLREKNSDLVVLNDVAEPGSGFGVDTNRVTLIRPEQAPEELPLMSKVDVARRVWDEVLALVARR